jgi:molybdopterin converting factor small subunit
MKVKLKILGFPEVEARIGKNEMDVHMNGNTLGDLVQSLEKAYGDGIKQALTVQILRNGREWIWKDDLGHRLDGDDQVTFLHMMEGG